MSFRLVDVRFLSSSGRRLLIGESPSWSRVPVLRIGVLTFAPVADDLTLCQNQLHSKSKRKRLEAMACILSHPHATPLDLAKCLCTEDNRNFEFMTVPGLLTAMRQSWGRLRGIDHPPTFRYLSKLHRSDPELHAMKVIMVLKLIGTERAVELGTRLRETTPPPLLKHYDQELNGLMMEIQRGRGPGSRRLP